jgi:hypothetical protein
MSGGMGRTVGGGADGSDARLLGIEAIHVAAAAAPLPVRLKQRPRRAGRRRGARPARLTHGRGAA